jgi:hypothetical protein
MESRAAREATWQALQRDLEQERGVTGRLRALRTPARVSLLALGAIAPAAIMALRHRAPLQLEHAAVTALIFAVCALLLAALSEPRRGWGRPALGWLAALLPLAGALVAGDASAVVYEVGHEHEPTAAACFGLGAAYTAPAFLLAVLVSRTPLRGATEVALLAGLCGISASITLDLHCHSQQLFHLLLGHASVGLGWAAAYQAATVGSASSSGRSNTSTMSKMS